MKSVPQTILFVHYGDEPLRGSERCLIDLVRHLDRERFTPVVWCNQHSLADEFRQMGVAVEVSYFPILLGWLPSRFDFVGFWRILRQGLTLVDRYKVGLVHANGSAPNQWMSIVARLRGIPLLSHLHSRYPMRDRFTQGLFNASLTVGVSHPVIEQLARDGAPAERLKVISNGIDCERQDAEDAICLREQLGIGDDDFVIMTTGSLIKRKGIDLLLTAMGELVREGLPVHLLIVGDGPEKPALQALAGSLSLCRRAHFLGESIKVAGLLRGSVDLYVSGAREEVFGLALAEAGLAGLAVVAPRVGGIPEVVEDGVSGLLVEPESAGALAQGISQLLYHPLRRQRMGKQGRERVLRLFDVRLYTRRLMMAYQFLFDNDSARVRLLATWHFAVLARMLLRVVYLKMPGPLKSILKMDRNEYSHQELNS